MYCLYRSPSSGIDSFLEKFYSKLTILHEKKLIFFIAGDFNIDTLSGSRVSIDFKNILQNFGATLTIKEHTRVTISGKSCPDNIITNFKGVMEGKVIETGISNHSAQILSFEARGQLPVQKTETRDFNNTNIFCNKLNVETWSDVYHGNDVNFSFSCFLSIFLHYFDVYFPKIKICKKRNKHFFHNDPKLLEFKQVVLYQTIAKFDNTL